MCFCLTKPHFEGWTHQICVCALRTVYRGGGGAFFIRDSFLAISGETAAGDNHSNDKDLCELLVIYICPIAGQHRSISLSTLLIPSLCIQSLRSPAMTYAFLLFFVYCLICFMIWTCKRLRDWEIKENRAIDTSLLRASSAGKSNLRSVHQKYSLNSPRWHSGLFAFFGKSARGIYIGHGS